LALDGGARGLSEEVACGAVGFEEG